MRNQAGFEAAKRHNVYSGYCRRNNYIAGFAHNLHSENWVLKHNFLAAQHSFQIPAAPFPHHVTTPAEAARHHLLAAERRQEITDKIVTWAAAAILLGILIAARWI